MIKKDLNTKQVGKLFGVDESTVRRWALSKKIKCSSSAGGHRKFSYNDIIEFSRKKGINLNSRFNINTTNADKIIKNAINYSLNNDHHSIELILIELYLKGIQLPDIMDNYIEKILINIQSELDKNQISVVEEHIARKIISKALNNFKLSISNNIPANAKNILCLNLENDIPDLPIDMIQILLESINYNVHNCGSHTSIKNIKKLLSNKKYEAIFIYLCDRQCCTSTVIDNIKKTNDDLKDISKLAKRYNIKLFLGGPSFNNINQKVLTNFNTFNKYSEALSINKF